MSRRLFGRTIALFGVLGALVACHSPKAPSPRARNLVLVTIDTLRADRLSCYGSRTVETPHLDDVFREGAMAPEASAQVPLTRPSHVTLLTGLYPSEHGIRDNVSPSLAEDVPTLATILKGSGFATAGFVSSIVLAAQSGLGRGFDTFSDKFEVSPGDLHFLNTIQRRGDIPTAEAIAWLQARKGERFFLWLHLYDPHEPYEPPEPFATRYAENPYDGEVAFADDLVGRLDSALEHLGFKKDTLLVVTSDHGEGLGEHGESVHGFFVYQTTLHVPLVMRGPGLVPGTRLPVTVRSVDLVPTLLDFLEVAPGGGRFSGRDLAPALRGLEKPAEEAAYAESLLPLLHYGWSDLRALREGRWKYIQAPRPELYDLKEDPGETRDLASSEPARVEAFRSTLAKRLAAEKVAANQGPSAIPEDLLEKLGALGYVGAGSGSSAEGQGADPKDKIEEFKVLNGLVREGIIALREERYAKSAGCFRDVLNRKVESFEVHYYLGRALLGLKEPREALPHFRKATEFLKTYGPAYLSEAECALVLHDFSGALEALARGTEIVPKDAALWEKKAQILHRLSRDAEAGEAYRKAIALGTRDPLLMVEYGELLRDLGDLPQAVGFLRDAVRLDPETASYWNSLGRVLGAKGDMGEAESAFREAFRLEPRNALYAFNVGLALERQGRAQEAGTFFRKATGIDPSFKPAREHLAGLHSGP
jgi:arylsulfatase A-like enzyme/Flp pilus assembly protein TadD